MAPELKEKLFTYIDLLTEEQQTSIVRMIESFIGNDNENEINIEDYNREINEAEAEIDRGEYIEHKELMKQLRNIKK